MIAHGYCRACRRAGCARLTLASCPTRCAAVRARPGRSSFLSVLQTKSFLYGGFVWPRRALNSLKRRLPARAVLVGSGRWRQPHARWAESFNKLQRYEETGGRTADGAPQGARIEP